VLCDNVCIIRIHRTSWVVPNSTAIHHAPYNTHVSGHWVIYTGKTLDPTLRWLQIKRWIALLCLWLHASTSWLLLNLPLYVCPCLLEGCLKKDGSSCAFPHTCATSLHAWLTHWKAQLARAASASLFLSGCTWESTQGISHTQPACVGEHLKRSTVGFTHIHSACFWLGAPKRKHNGHNTLNTEPASVVVHLETSTMDFTHEACTFDGEPECVHV